MEFHSSHITPRNALRVLAAAHPWRHERTLVHLAELRGVHTQLGDEMGGVHIVVLAAVGFRPVRVTISQLELQVL